MNSTKCKRMPRYLETLYATRLILWGNTSKAAQLAEVEANIHALGGVIK